MDLILFTPLYISLFYFRRISIRALLLGLFIGTIYFFTVDPFAVIWRAWQFNPIKTLPPLFGPTLGEELFWSVLTFGFTAMLVRILSDAEEKGIKFKDLLKK
jgi:hypothetical protein